MSSTLESLKATGTTVVSDSGDFQSIAQYKPQDATTNPSLILAAVKDPKYASIIDTAVKYGKEKSSDKDEQIEHTMNRLLVEFGKAILELIPGRVSTEVDARLSFDTQGTIKKAKELIALYESLGIDRKRVLIKIASTWEGIQAAKHLEQNEQIHCNLTLLFGFQQAVACAEAGVTLISPFVGRILDWYKKNKPEANYDGPNDPGVHSVQKIYRYYKQQGYNTIVMGASFRTLGEIQELAGIDFLTISTGLLDQLKNGTDKYEKKLDVATAKKEQAIPKVSFISDEPAFRWSLLEDSMAFDKLHEGIKKFADDAVTLKDILRQKL